MAQLSVDELLTTTRAVRRRLDLTRPVPPALVKECLEIALQAPTASNRQDWHFVVVTDPQLRAEIAGLYRRSYDRYRRSPGFAGALYQDDPPRAQVQRRVGTSADHLAAHLHEVPVHLIPCIRRKPRGGNQQLAGLYGSILPAVWSFMLAARSRSLGTAWTTLHLAFEEEAAAVLGIPFEEVTQVALVPVAYTSGAVFRRAPRAPLDEVLSWDRWGQPAPG